MSSRKTTVDLVDNLLKLETNNTNRHIEFNNSRKIKFLFLRYEDRSSWFTDTDELWGPDIEAEYIVDVLTNDNRLDKFTFMSIPRKYDISKIESCDILAYSINVYSRTVINKYIDKLKPKVLFHLSDEFAKGPKYIKQFEKVKLVYRQYNFLHKPEYAVENRNSIKFIPIGYHSWGKKYKRTGKIPINKRKYKWCFSGSAKNQREKQLELLSTIKPHFFGKTAPFEAANMFNNSVFAFCPPGNCNIECSRIWEAMYNGCIPIILCNDKRECELFKNSFKFEIPCFFTTSIDDVKNIINNTSKSEITRVQRACTKWLKDISRSIRDDVINAVRPAPVKKTARKRKNIST